MDDIACNINAMVTVALGYNRASKALNASLANALDAFGVSSSLLSTLCLEILLKALHLSGGRRFKHTHNYAEIWNDVAGDAKEDVLRRAKERFGPHAELEELEQKLSSLSHVFTHARYTYELNLQRSNEEIIVARESWLAQGGEPEDADFAFYPATRDALIFAILQHLQDKHDLAHE